MYNIIGSAWVKANLSFNFADVSWPKLPHSSSGGTAEVVVEYEAVFAGHIVV